jgi:signal transduction histidine kinase
MPNLPAKNLEYILSSLRHEIMNPLSRIILHLELLEENPKNREVKEEIGSIVDEITGIVNNSIELYSKVESLDLSLLIDRLVSKDYSKTKYTPQLGRYTIESSQGAIRQIMHNLLSNAEKYSEAEGCEVELLADESYVRIRVIDRGLPIPMEFVDRIFERGFRLEKDFDKPGEGIGLHVSKGLAKRLNGRLTYYREGNKNVFELSIPNTSNNQ